MRNIRQLDLAILAFAFSPLLLYGQSASTSGNCPPVKAKNKQEALMMEAASHKQGCWVRNPKTGQLVLMSNLSPDKNYKPLALPDTQGVGNSTCRPSWSGTSVKAPVSRLASLDLVGTWAVKSGITGQVSAHLGQEKRQDLMCQHISVTR